MACLGQSETSWCGCRRKKQISLGKWVEAILHTQMTTAIWAPRCSSEWHRVRDTLQGNECIQGAACLRKAIMVCLRKAIMVVCLRKAIMPTERMNEKARGC